MVLDNADRVETFFPSVQSDHQLSSLAAYLPQSCNGSILVTSRSKDAAYRLVGGYSNIREVRAMDEAQGLQLLRNKLQDAPSKESAANLLHALDHMPLAISQAAAYINRRAHMTTTSYLEEFSANNKKKESLLNWETGDLRRDASASNSVVTTWQMSFECIQEERPSAADLLSLMSFFSPQGIPEPALRRHRRTSSKFSNQDGIHEMFEADLDLLRAYSLVTATAGTNVCEMHSLVQFCTRVWLSTAGNAKRWESEFVELMAREFPVAKFENWAQCQQLLPHTELLFDSSGPTNDATLKSWAQVLTNAAIYLWMLGSYKAGQVTASMAVTIQEKVLEQDDGMTLQALNNVALLMQALGRYDDAEKLHRQTLAARDKMLGQDHEATLLSLSNLAGVLQDQGKLDEAATLHRQVLNVRDKVLGRGHETTLVSVNSLAAVLHAQGKYKDAERLNREALEGWRAMLDEQHPHVLQSINNLAGSLQAQGRYDEAEPLYRQTLEWRKQQLGDQHPSTLTSMNNLASVLLAHGKYDEAERLNRQVLEARKQVDENHPFTWTSMSNLARVLHAQQKYQEAETLNRQALEGREKGLGNHHPDTLSSVNNLANLLTDLKRYEAAGLLYQRACDGLEQSLGLQHPWTIACRSDFSAMQVKEQHARSQAETKGSLYARLKMQIRRKSSRAVENT
jgi:tetratricopeptide (TPR) repeat protein